MKGFKEAKDVLNVLGVTQKSSYCKQRMAEITNYVKASIEERKAMDWMAEQIAATDETVSPK